MGAPKACAAPLSYYFAALTLCHFLMRAAGKYLPIDVQWCYLACDLKALQDLASLLAYCNKGNRVYSHQAARSLVGFPNKRNIW